MDNFIQLYKMYRSVTRLRVALMIYRNAPSKWKLGLWIGKAIFVVFAIFQLFFHPFYFFGVALGALIWGMSFDRSCKAVFESLYQVCSERMKFFELDYEYVRYLQFREMLKSESCEEGIDAALDFLEVQLETDKRNVVFPSRVNHFLLGAFLAVLGGAVGQWSSEVALSLLLVLIVSLCFSFLIAGNLYSKQVGFKEFKRFLLWAKDEG